jgi:hypothetical protein
MGSGDEYCSIGRLFFVAEMNHVVWGALAITAGKVCGGDYRKSTNVPHGRLRRTDRGAYVSGNQDMHDLVDCA